MHISKYIRFGDTLERCCKGKAFIWIVQGFLQRKCYMGIISTHSSLGINPSIVPFSDEKLMPMAMSLRLSEAYGLV